LENEECYPTQIVYGNKVTNSRGLLPCDRVTGVTCRARRSSVVTSVTSLLAYPLMSAPCTKMIWDRNRNLRRGGAPARGRGRLQRQIARAFTIGGPELTSSTILDWCYPHRRQALTTRHRFSVWRLLAATCDRVGRDWKAPGQPWVWRLKSDVDHNNIP